MWLAGVFPCHFLTQLGGVGGVGVGGWGNGDNCGAGVRASISKPTPIHIPSLWKNGPIHILDHPKFDLFIHFPLIFCTYLLLIVRQILQSIHWIPREQAASKISEQRMCVIPGCQKSGAFHIGIQKNRVIYILCVEKRGPIIYLAALKKGVIRHAHPYYAIYRQLPPPPPPPPPPRAPPSGQDFYFIIIILVVRVVVVVVLHVLFSFLRSTKN